jgi:ADP-dependent NAD(P)H-hydrate dehydratase / NAD(P)H-hydrate epimerase
MKVVTAAEMREIDRLTIEEYGITGQSLMERAGAAVATRAMELFPGMNALVICGGGNNGGDGLVAALNLLSSGYPVRVIMLADEGRLSPDCMTQYRIAEAAGVSVAFRSTLTPDDFRDAFVVDAVFGTGLSKQASGDIAAAFRAVSESSVPVLAVDIASGISSDTGAILGEAIKADHTVTFGLPKRGHFLYPGAGYTGCLYVEDIGFPERLTESEKIVASLIHRGRAASLIPSRLRNSYKGDYGHVLVVAGSRGKTGAALMTAGACLRSGSGLVTIAVPESLMNVFQGRVTEEMIIPLPDRGDGTLDKKALKVILDFACSRADVIAIGPGIGVTASTEKIVRGLVLSSAVPLVIDADGLNSLKDCRDIFSRAKSPLVITPHPGEMAGLLSQDAEAGSRKPEAKNRKAAAKKRIVTIEDIERDRIDTALSFSRETGVYAVLKGVPTIVAGPDGEAFINTTGNPGMATAGSGDVLTGIVASFIGQGMNPLDASVAGVCMHGLAGDAAAEEKGEHSLIASDIISALPAAFRSLL